jgi:hypothetical protein
VGECSERPTTVPSDYGGSTMEVLDAFDNYLNTEV